MQNPQQGQGIDKEKQAAPVKPDDKMKDKEKKTGDKDDKSGGCGSCG